MVAVFAGEELRSKREVVLAGGKSYVTLNVNLEGTEDVSFRIWEEEQRKEYKVTETMALDMGETYGSAEELVKLDVVAPRVGVPIVSFMRQPFGFEFKSELVGQYVIEVTSDLKEWKELKTLEGVKERTQFIPEKESKINNRYFRVRMQQ